MWQGASPGTYDKAADLLKNDAIAAARRSPVQGELTRVA